MYLFERLLTSSREEFKNYIFYMSMCVLLQHQVYSSEVSLQSSMEIDDELFESGSCSSGSVILLLRH